MMFIIGGDDVAANPLIRKQGESMKLKACFLAALLIIAGSIAHAFDTVPLQISIWPPNMQVVPQEIDVSGLKLNLPYGGNNNIFGLDLGIASTSTDCAAFQVNLLNMADNSFSGFQVGLFNLSGDSAGVQIGLANITDHVADGLQISLVNSALETNGVQIGLVNYTHFMVGVQIGLVNIIRESVVKFFPIINFCF